MYERRESITVKYRFPNIYEYTIIQLQPIPALAHWLILVTWADAGCDIEKGMYMYHCILYSICIFDLFSSNIKSETYIYVPD